MTEERGRPNDEQLLLAAFRAACEGPFFPDMEFATLMGFTRDDLRTLTARWPTVADERVLDLAVNNVINNLIGYPHGQTDELRRFIDSEPNVLAGLLQRWRAGSSPLPHSLSLMVASGWEDQPLEQAIETYFRYLENLGETTVPGMDSTQALDDAGYDGGLFIWLTQAVTSGRPGEAEQAWPVIIELVARAPDEPALGIIGAGAIEDLARRHGFTFALRLIERTASDPRFRQAMGHVWFGDAPDWPRKRLEVLRGNPAYEGGIPATPALRCQAATSALCEPPPPAASARPLRPRQRLGLFGGGRTRVGTVHQSPDRRLTQSCQKHVQWASRKRASEAIANPILLPHQAQGHHPDGWWRGDPGFEMDLRPCLAD